MCIRDSCKTRLQTLGLESMRSSAASKGTISVLSSCIAQFADTPDTSGLFSTAFKLSSSSRAARPLNTPSLKVKRILLSPSLSDCERLLSRHCALTFAAKLSAGNADSPPGFLLFLELLCVDVCFSAIMNPSAPRSHFDSDHLLVSRKEGWAQLRE
eukprot:2694874-Prymnesium_polylepis.1